MDEKQKPPDDEYYVGPENVEARVDELVELVDRAVQLKDTVNQPATDELMAMHLRIRGLYPAIISFLTGDSDEAVQKAEVTDGVNR